MSRFRYQTACFNTISCAFHWAVTIFNIVQDTMNMKEIVDSPLPTTANLYLDLPMNHLDPYLHAYERLLSVIATCT
jgi:hypothetical protein